MSEAARSPHILSYRSTAGMLRRAARAPMSRERSHAMLGIAAQEAAYALQELARPDPAVEAATLACQALVEGKLSAVKAERLILGLADVIEALKRERRLQGYVPQNFYTKDQLEAFFTPETSAPPAPPEPVAFRLI